MEAVMEQMLTRRGGGVSMLVIVAALLGSVAPGYAQEAAIVQARTIATLVIRTVNCFTHPCVGDSESHVRQLLNRRLVSDGYFDYSDLATSYPSMRGVFQGVVEWNLEGTLKDISLMIVNFQVPRDVLGAELERTLPDCNFKAGSKTHDLADDQEETGKPTTEWKCSVHSDEGRALNITFDLAPDLVIVEIESRAL